MSTRIGVDVGGTFTDLIAFDAATGEVMITKSASNADAPEEAVIVSVMGGVPPEVISAAEYFLHGTTVGLNALLQRSGARLGLLATAGFRDVLEIRRGSREEMLNLWWRPPEPLVPRELRIPVGERTRADGTVQSELPDGDVAAAADIFKRAGVEAVAIAFINAYCNPDNELAAAAALRRHGFDGEISVSHQVSGEYREFERTSTTVIDAYVRGIASGYLKRLGSGLREAGCDADLLLMRSGGAMSFEEAAARPFETIISGPVAGVEGAASLARELEIDQVIAADVGGTSFDVSVVLNGRPQAMNEGEVIGFPVQAPWVDVRSIGAGGGSIAEIDAGGLLRVGPRSAGSVPGPACYGRGGTEATVTDAAFSLGMLGEGRLADGLELDAARAQAALEELGSALDMLTERVAQGILRVASAHMADAIREITVERGLDPRDGALIAFGGAGGLFATLLATESEIPRVVIPPFSGNFSAWGLLGADLTQTAAQTMIAPLNDESTGTAEKVLGQILAELQGRAGGRRADNGTAPEAALDLRYEGQEYSLTVPVPLAAGTIDADSVRVARTFEQEYEKIFGHRMQERIEIVAVRGTLRTLMRERVEAPKPSADGEADAKLRRAYSFAEEDWLDFPLVQRGSLPVGTTLTGPALIAEETAMTYLDSGFCATVHPSSSLMIEPGGGHRV